MRPYIYTNDAGIYIGKILSVGNQPNSETCAGNSSLSINQERTGDFINDFITANDCTREYTQTSSTEYIKTLLESGNHETKEFIKNNKKVYVIVGTIHGGVSTRDRATYLEREGLFGYTVDVVEINGDKITRRLSKKTPAFFI